VNENSPLKPNARPRTPKGHRPNNLGDAHAERVLSIAMALAAEVSALYQRVDIMTRIAEKKGMFGRAEIEAYAPSAAEQKEWDEWRKAYLQRLLRILWDDVPEKPADAEKSPYAEFVKDLAR
jgi:hypothetical protein